MSVDSGTIHQARQAALATFLCVLLSACAASPGAADNIAGARGEAHGSRASICKAGDTEVNSSSQCLQDEAACYPLSTGKWCTGERGSTCPAGSSPLPAGMTCAPGARCFRVSESLECTIH